MANTVTKVMAERCVTHHFACDCREYRIAAARRGGKRVGRVHGGGWERGYTGTMSEFLFDDEEVQCDHWIDITRQAFERIRSFNGGEKKDG